MNNTNGDAPRNTYGWSVIIAALVLLVILVWVLWHER